jgi:dolichol-phosphate mannosyltransferase
MRKPSPPVVSIILPTYNEKENIADLIKAIDAAVSVSKEILVVDDDSPDGTALEVAKLQKLKPGIPVRLIIRKSDRGLVLSLNEGIRQSAGKIIAWMDADFSHPPEVLDKLIGSVINDGYDAVIASRFKPGGRQKPNSPNDSRLAVTASTFFNRTLSIIFKLPVTDFTSGFIAVRKGLLSDYRLRGSYGEYFPKLVMHLTKQKASIRETGYISPPRRSGVSKTTLLMGIRYLITAGSLWLKIN